MPCFPDLDAPLAAPGVVVRLAAEWDIPEILIAHQDDPQLHARIGLPRPPSGAELGRRTEHGGDERSAGTSVWLTILAPGSEECRGQIDVNDVDWDHRRAGLVVWVAPRDRGRGLATGALALTARWLLESCGLERVELLAQPANEPLLRAAQAAGFAREGVLRAYVRERRRRIDVVVMSIVRGDLEGAEYPAPPASRVRRVERS
ncbi:MAG: GNAT family N-acetyltransferase [Solirubrobacteraceae bacterium]